MQTQPGGISGVSSEDAGGLRGVLEGLVPVGLLAVVLALGIGLTIGARLAIGPQGFDLEQAVVVPVLAVTIVVAAAVYTIACVRALRRVRALEGAGNQPRARGVLWGLALTAIIVLVPIVVAAVLPQHPAP